MINAEFQRNLWLKFSLGRLLTIPALLGLVFWIHAVSGDEIDSAASRLIWSSQIAFMISAWFCGVQQASASVFQEVTEHTWDQQRLSAFTPWSMTWGKLFGSTSLVWYAGILCLFVYIIASLIEQTPLPETLRKTGALLAIAIWMQACGLISSIQSRGLNLRVIRPGALNILFIFIGLVLIPRWFIEQAAHGINPAIEWWGFGIDPDTFLLASAVFFAACAVFAAWRAMSHALQERTTPWAWPLFACLLAAYVAGFWSNDHLSALLWNGLAIATLMTYLALLAENNDIVTWKRIGRRAIDRNWRRLFEQLPMWPTTLLLAAIATMAICVRGSFESQVFFAMENSAPFLAPIILLTLLRDACMIIFFAFGPRPSRAAAAIIVYLILINGLLPLLAQIVANRTIFAFLLPLSDAQLPGLISISAHLLIAAGLLYWRIPEALRVKDGDV